MQIIVRQKLYDQFLKDPVLAASVIMKADLDVFQAARLRIFWFTRGICDNSGVGTGKDETTFIFNNLRCILIPGIVSSIYYLSHHTGKREYWPKFERYIDQAPLYRDQFKRIRRTYGDANWQNVLAKKFKNGSTLQLPPGDFASDSASQASLTFNDLSVMEVVKIDDASDGLAKQLLDRVRGGSFNKDHPIWRNKIVLQGHAGDIALNKSYKRVADWERRRKQGSTKYYLFTANFTDYNAEFLKRKKKQIDTSEIQENLREGTPDEVKGRTFGIWGRGGMSWYAPDLIHKRKRQYVMPYPRRLAECEYFSLGQDTATSKAKKADFTSGFVWRVVPIEEGRKCGMNLEATHFDKNGTAYHVAPRWANQFTGVDVDVIAGWMHYHHRNFNFNRIVMDPGGGGLSVYGFLKRPMQIIAGEMVECTGLRRADDHTAIEADPIVTMFERKTEMAKLWEDVRFDSHNDGILDRGHTLLRRGLIRGKFLLPAPMEERSGDSAKMDDACRTALKCISVAVDQMTKARLKMDGEGMAEKTSKGFLQFLFTGKKDLLMALLYGYMGALLIIDDLATGFEGAGGGDDDGVAARKSR